MLKKLMLLAAMLAMVLVAAAPAMAQEDQYQNVEGGEGGTNTATVTNSECVNILQAAQGGDAQGSQQYQEQMVEEGGGSSARWLMRSGSAR